jgi:hypothetical protein
MKKLAKGTFSYGVGNPRKIYGKEIPVAFNWTRMLLIKK